jgi:hypothetical protein
MTSISGDGYVFDATHGADLVVKAYDSSWNTGGGTVENPYSGALIATQTFNCGYSDNTPFSFSLNNLTDAVLFTFSDSGYYDVGIDNLNVNLVPVPGAFLLGAIGLGVAGMKLRKRA